MENSALVYRQFGEPASVLQAETARKGPLMPGNLRVQMLCAPVNASDLIPITGAYRHRVILPGVAGYEGVGRVIAAPQAFQSLVGKRVLPLRGEGTWQQVVDCPAELAVPVPDEIETWLAARAFINPLAAQLMLRLCPPEGKRVLLTAAGSDCAILLGQWARQMGATAVWGIHRSPAHAARLAAMGITPLAQQETAAILSVAAQCDIVYDATGGALAQALLEAMPQAGEFISYGLLSGQPFTLARHYPPVRWFHIRNTFSACDPQRWQAEFRALWPRLLSSHYSESVPLPFNAWREALQHYYQPGRVGKPVLQMAQEEA